MWPDALPWCFPWASRSYRELEGTFETLSCCFQSPSLRDATHIFLHFSLRGPVHRPLPLLRAAEPPFHCKNCCYSTERHETTEFSLNHTHWWTGFCHSSCFSRLHSIFYFPTNQLVVFLAWVAHYMPVVLIVTWSHFWAFCLWFWWRIHGRGTKSHCLVSSKLN